MSDAGTAPVAVAVIVPAYRAEATIGRCLEALADQRGAPPFEVVLVDSSPGGSTAEAARASAAVGAGRLRLRCECAPNRLYPGSARNRGAAVTDAERLLFLDADCLAAPDLVARAARTAPGEVVGGSIALRAGAPVSARLRHLLEFKESLPGVTPRVTWTLPSACVVFDRAVFERHGGFPDARASEDWLLDWRMWQAGEALRFDPALRVEHLTPSGWRPLTRYLRLLGAASGAARRRGGLPGQTVVRHPGLALALPFARTARALAWCARYSPRDFAFLLIAWPAYLAMAGIWAIGFREGLRDGDVAIRSLAAQESRE